MRKYITFLLFFISFSVNASYVNWKFERVVDGDTLLFTASELPPELDSVYVRVLGLDTPESTHIAKCPKERKLGVVSKMFLESLVVGRTIKVDVKKWDKYGGRVLADVYIDELLLKDLMINRNLGREYFGERKSDWCK